MKILFRVSNNQNDGLGHVVRSLQIANKFSKKGIDTYIVTDKPINIDFKSQNISSEIKVHLENFIELSELEKAIKIDGEKIIFDLLVIDSFDLNVIVQYVRKFERDKAFLIVDNLRTFPNFDNKIGIGIKFGRNEDSVLYPVRNLPEISGKSKKMKILIYFGSHILDSKVIAFIKILDDISKQKFFSEYEMVFFAHKDSDLFFKLKERLNSWSQSKKTKLIDNIDDYWGDYCLIIGSASTIIYEAYKFNIPMITIAMNESQKNFDWQLERLGHYINFLTLEELLNDKFQLLVSYILKNLQLIRHKSFSNCVGLDPNSANKIANLILNKKSNILNPNLIKSNNIESSVRVEALDLKHINRLIEARNTETQNKFLVKSEKISKLDHYLWWFQNKRQNYVLSWGNNECVYIWHQQAIVEEREYLIGGWLPLQASTKFERIVEALSWQLNYVSGLINTPWLAVIHNANKSTLFLNSRAGFEEVTESTIEYWDACKIFELGDKQKEFKVLKKSIESSKSCSRG